MKPRTFEEAVELYERMIKGQLKKLCIYRDYEEFYQCGLIALWQAYESFDEKKGVFPAYALLVVRGHLRNRLQLERKMAERHIPLAPQLTELLTYEERTDELVQYLAPLTKQQRLIVQGHLCDGKKLKEIAREQSMSYEQVRSIYRRALQRVKEYACKHDLI